MIGPSALLAASAVAVAMALQISDGRYDPLALAVVSAAALASVAAAVWRRWAASPPENPVAAQALLGAASAAGLASWMFGSPLPVADPRAFQGGFRWFVLISLVVLSAYLCIHLRASLIRARFLLLLLFFAVMGLVAIRAGRGGETAYAALALILAGAWLLARALPGNGGELAATLVLFQPRALLVPGEGLSGALVFFCFALALFALARRAHQVLAGGALTLLAASTPYSPLLAIPLALRMERRPALWAIGAVVVAELSPFAGGGPGSWRPVLQRPDALSFVAPVVGGGVPVEPGIGLVLGAVVLAISLRRRPDLPLACASAAAAFSVALLCSPNAFANAWWLCAGLLAAAAAPRGTERVGAPARPPAEQVPSGAGAG